MLLSRIRAFIRSADGPTAVEYAVMLAMIVVICLTAINKIGKNSKTTFKTVGASLKSAS